MLLRALMLHRILTAIDDLGTLTGVPSRAISGRTRRTTPPEAIASLGGDDKAANPGANEERNP